MTNAVVVEVSDSAGIPNLHPPITIGIFPNLPRRRLVKLETAVLRQLTAIMQTLCRYVLCAIHRDRQSTVGSPRNRRQHPFARISRQRTGNGRRRSIAPDVGQHVVDVELASAVAVEQVEADRRNDAAIDFVVPGPEASARRHEHALAAQDGRQRRKLTAVVVGVVAVVAVDAGERVGRQDPELPGVLDQLPVDGVLVDAAELVDDIEVGTGRYAAARRHQTRARRRRGVTGDERRSESPCHSTTAAAGRAAAETRQGRLLLRRPADGVDAAASLDDVGPQRRRRGVAGRVDRLAGTSQLIVGDLVRKRRPTRRQRSVAAVVVGTAARVILPETVDARADATSGDGLVMSGRPCGLSAGGESCGRAMAIPGPVVVVVVVAGDVVLVR